jgi:CheY-like chemotaxis protein
MADPQIAPKDVVLVVDDEPEIRRMATHALSESGFKAEVAEDGKGGLECFIKHQPRICLVLSDVVMPVMDGLRMVERILELDPEMKVLFMTGYSDAQLEVLARTKFPLIRKPFLPADLGRKLNDMLKPFRRSEKSMRA